MSSTLTPEQKAARIEFFTKALEELKDKPAPAVEDVQPAKPVAPPKKRLKKATLQAQVIQFVLNLKVEELRKLHAVLVPQP